MPVSLYDSTASRFVVPGAQIDVANPVNWQHDLNVGRVAWWKVIGNPGWRGGNTWRDLVRGGGHTPNDGVVSGTLGTNVKWQGAKPPGGSGSLFLDGSTGRILVGTTSTFSFIQNTGVFAVSLWVNLTTLANTPGFFDSNAGASANKGVSIWTTTTGALRGFVTNGASGLGPWNLTSAAGAIVANAWTHVCATADGTTLTLFVNGKSVVSGVRVNALSSGNNSFAPQIGNFNSANEGVTGLIDGVSIWNRVLTAQDVAADYTLCRQGYPGVLNRLSPPTVFKATTVSGLLLKRRRKLCA